MALTFAVLLASGLVLLYAGWRMELMSLPATPPATDDLDQEGADDGVDPLPAADL